VVEASTVATRKGWLRATTTSVMPMRTNGRRPSAR